MGYQVNPDIPLLSCKIDNEIVVEQEPVIPRHDTNSNFNRKQRLFQAVEDTGSSILFRCIKCRSCKDCKDHEIIENISLKEEIEQDLIVKSVAVDKERRITVASLPFIQNLNTKLISNKDIALRIYHQQVTKLDKSRKDKSDVIKA